MVVAACKHETKHKHGKDRHGNERYKCALCGQTFVDAAPSPIGDLRISLDKAVLALSLMLEGMSVRSVQRLTGLCRQTLADLIIVVGDNCQRFMDSKMRCVRVSDVQVDEIWSFVGMKEKIRASRNRSEEFGDSWTFIAIERDTKLIMAHQIGKRDGETCRLFIEKLNSATVGRFQLTSDGLSAYKANVPFVMDRPVDFAQLVKTYASTQEQTRYSPAQIIGADKHPVMGSPDRDRISTSRIERMNLTVRMTLRRFTRLTNAHSKSSKHHEAMQAIFFAWHNWCRKHETLKGRTPAMASGLADRVWGVKELLKAAA